MLSTQSTNWPVPLPEVHARTERPESGWEAVSAASARDRETRTTLGECSRRPWPSAGAGALSSLRARREGRPAQPRAPKAAFPPRGRAGPFAPAHSPFAPPLRRLEQAAPQARPFRPSPLGPEAQLSGGGEPGSPEPRPVLTVTTRLDSQHFPNRQAPSGWRLERPLIAPPLGLAASAANGDQEAGGGGASLSFGGRWAWRVGGRGPMGGTKRGCSRDPPVTGAALGGIASAHRGIRSKLSRIYIER
uniref:Uncharacterized protein n=1 Tax=Rangifer tarandus platyrhynchus TaxID=3082113 RepID=A0ACB0DPR7_RANTA|nr:unnamed protein product [Rangifer tarandus platyrhynchus]